MSVRLFPKTTGKSVRDLLLEYGTIVQKGAFQPTTLADFESEIVTAANQKLVDRKEMAALLDISISTLDGLVKNENLPTVLLPSVAGKKRPIVRFRPDQVIEWRERHQALRK